LDKLPDSVIKHSTAVAKAGTKKSPLTWTALRPVNL
jgi:hypothetical protein